MRLRTAAACLLTAALCAGPGAARAEAESGTIRLRFHEAPLSALIRAVSMQTGAQFLYDEELARAKVTVTGYDLVTPEEALRVLEAALLVSQLAAIPTPSGVIKIVPYDNGLTEAGLRGGPT